MVCGRARRRRGIQRGSSAGAEGGWAARRRPDRQSTGVGKTIVRTAADWLIDRGITTLGLETCRARPRTRLLRTARIHTSFLHGDADQRNRDPCHPAPVLLSRRSADEKDAAMASGRRLVSDLVSGIDFHAKSCSPRSIASATRRWSRAMRGSTRCGVGTPRRWPTAGRGRSPRVEAGRADRARRRRDRRGRAAAAKAGFGGSVRCQSRYAEAFRRLIARGIACVGPICG